MPSHRDGAMGWNVAAGQIVQWPWHCNAKTLQHVLQQTLQWALQCSVTVNGAPSYYGSYHISLQQSYTKGSDVIVGGARCRHRMRVVAARNMLISNQRRRGICICLYLS